MKKMGIFEEFGNLYHEYGWTVIPLRGKQPFIDGWNQYFDKPVSDELFEEWIKKYPDANIGLPMGKQNGLVCVDIDSNDANVVAKIVEALPRTQLSKRGKNGISLFYLNSGLTQSQRLYVGGVHIGELLVKHQTVLPPSIHPDTGTEYVWTGQLTLQMDKEDVMGLLPELTYSHIKFLLNGNMIAGSGRTLNLSSLAMQYAELDYAPSRAVEELIKMDLIMHRENPLFSDSSEIIKGSAAPEHRALKFYLSHLKTYKQKQPITVVSNSESSLDLVSNREAEYFDFFYRCLPSARKDIVSGGNDVFVRTDGRFRNVLNMIPLLRAIAEDHKLQKSKIEDHLMRWCEQIPEGLLIDIKSWDGVDHIGNMCSQVTFGSDVEAKVFCDYVKFWGARALQRAFNYSLQNICLVIHGEQRIGKDHWISHMVSGFAEYTAGFMFDNNVKDVYVLCSKKLIIHAEEFDQIQKYDAGFLKQLITKREVDVRLPYSRASQTLQVRSSWIASVNRADFFGDSTGNTRFALFKALKFDWTSSRPTGDQILAQWKALADANYQLSDESTAYMAGVLTNSTPVDSIDMIVENWNSQLEARLNNPGWAYNPRKEGFLYKDVVDVFESTRGFVGCSMRYVQSTVKRLGGLKRLNNSHRYFMIKK